MNRPLIILVFALLSVSPAQKLGLQKFVTDTLIIPLPEDSSLAKSANITIEDRRDVDGRVVGIRQIDKWLVIPVDQYFVLPASLSRIFARFLSNDSLQMPFRLDIDQVIIWEDTQPLLSKGWMLNASTRLVSQDGETVNTWQWEFRNRKGRKQKTEDVIGQLLMDWIDAQKNALRMRHFSDTFVSRKYRRQMVLWVDTIVLRDGYIVDGRLSLYFPSDQMKSFVRGIPGIYYRRSSLHESIAIGGTDQQWYYRFGSSWLARVNVSGRLGFNTFNTDKFGYMDWQNILLINGGLTGTVEYRPVYRKGLFAGIGLHQSVNILPEVVPRFETGIALSLGMVLP